MKKFILSLLIITVVQCNCFAKELDYTTFYENAVPFESKLYHDIDPYQDEDAIKYSWSPYPLFRTSTTLYFKDFKISPGYYILTPRKLKEKEYVFFKQNGKVSFIIPVAKKEATPLNFYEANKPQMKLTKWQKFCEKVRTKFYNSAKDSGRVSPPNSHVDVTIEDNFIVVSLFFGEDKYILLFKRSPY